MRAVALFVSTLLTSLGFLCATLVPSKAVFDIFGAIDGQGADALVDSYPFSIFPNSTKNAAIIFESDDYAGVVTVQVTCCANTSGDILSPTGLTVEFVRVNPRFHIPSNFIATGLARLGGAPPTKSPPPAPPDPPGLKSNQFVAVAHGARLLALTVTTSPGVMTGRFFARVDAVKSDGTFASTKVTINVLPTLIDTKTPMCAALTTASGDNTIPSGPATPGATLIPADPTSQLSSLFLKKTASPNMNQWEIGYGLASVQATEGQNVVLTKSMLPLDPTMAMFGFKNSTFGDKQYVLFNGSSCTPTDVIQLKSGEHTSLIVTSLTTTTILFRMTTDGKSWENISIMSEGSFWTMFGGKEVDFEWIEGGNTVYGCSFC